MVKDVKIFYYAFRGRAELPRLVLTLAGTPFEDVRLEKEEDQKAELANSPTKKLPYLSLDLEDGNGAIKLPQSAAIAKYFAKKNGLMGKDDFEAFLADIIVGECDDLFTKIVGMYMEKDAAEKATKEKDLKEKYLPGLMTYLEKCLAQCAMAGGTEGFMLPGGKLSIADLAAYDIIKSAQMQVADCLKDCPKLQKLMTNVAENAAIKAYIDKHPKLYEQM